MLVNTILTKTKKADLTLDINQIKEIRALQISSHRPATLLKQRLLYRCFPVKFAKFLTTPFLQTRLDDCFCTFKNKASDAK